MVPEKVKSWAQKKEKKYESMPPERLQKKDLQNQRDTSRHATATTVGGGTAILSHGLSTPIHGSLAVRHAALTTKSKAKETISERVLENKGLQRRKPTFTQSLSDHARGAADGGFGIDTLDQWLSGK